MRMTRGTPEDVLVPVTRGLRKQKFSTRILISLKHSTRPGHIRDENVIENTTLGCIIATILFCFIF